ncbi:glutaredoxin family protein [Paraburkholderia caballeronis]|uniref:Glutaredoxin-like domain n=1 Tax=Paraburkholderia caballeronis TaxID=416943 RepID=A0A1H7MKC5_9BURK|nr:glutaredoxin family protein [Paraburkholderia caballeronis]PXW26541.1 glutaredoxin-like protein DUF836 [Paraburkholderia caballeronis]PXX02088.1 glutaredoxin-like protein DUF836 [Paraburkholderia caballeronis]RAK01245.1 glutaredoxin-like protein DUF836 [Paraburkholderia caballeronis]SEB89609.1 Glutaredoxin-like domain [Paraburkholderia caballeronis]SEL11561.1 Glutaredoxin-like domain [Paraburkholderia caballeronis]
MAGAQAAAGGPDQRASPGAPHLVLYGRAWCHLCDDMRAALEPMLAGTGARFDVIDVDSDPALQARYDELVPVLVCDGVELCHYHLDEVRVRAALLPRPA